MIEAPTLHDDGVDTRVRRYALFGHPIQSSRSPRIHAAFAEQTGIALHYDLISTQADEFPDRLAQFEREGGLGGNVTTPIKAVAAGLCRELSPRAQRAGVVNTLVRLDERACALEALVSIRRAGADAILTYFALDAARWLREAG